MWMDLYPMLTPGSFARFYGGRKPTSATIHFFPTNYQNAGPPVMSQLDDRPQSPIIKVSSELPEQKHVFKNWILIYFVDLKKSITKLKTAVR